MEATAALQFRSRVEDFRRRHRTGLVTLLFSDVVGSTQLKEKLGDERGVALLQSHHALVRASLGQFTEAEEISTWGDSFFIVFVKPSDAVRFALLLQHQLRDLSAGSASEMVHDRVGLHMGEVVIEEDAERGKPKDLYGLQVDVCARLMDLALPDQVLLSRPVFDSARPVLKGQDSPGLSALSWLNHGCYRFRGLEEPMEVCEAGETAFAPLRPPPDSKKGHRVSMEYGLEVLGWRPALGQLVAGTRWELERKLGEGGFGEVWLASHQVLKQHRVFKFCFRPDRVRWLRREAALFRVLHERTGEHRNILGLLNVNFDDPPFYIEMDYCEGGDLKAWSELQGGPGRVPLRVRLEIMAQVADALAAAHSSGVIHRDIKPGNILLESSTQPVTETGQTSGPAPLVKLTDFGVGHVVSNEIVAGLALTGLTATTSSTGSVQSGTLIYMAPELLSRKPASPQSDIYSLGVVLFQFLVGDFSRALTVDWANEFADALQLRAVLARCFAGEPAHRYSSASQLAADIRQCAAPPMAETKKTAGLPAERRVRSVRLRRALVGVSVGLILLGLCGVFLHQFWFRMQAVRKLGAGARHLTVIGDWAEATRWWQQLEDQDRNLRPSDRSLIRGITNVLGLLAQAQQATNSSPASATNLCALAITHLSKLEQVNSNAELKAILTSLGGHASELLRNAQSMGMGSPECREALAKARRAESSNRWDEAGILWRVAAEKCPGQEGISNAIAYANRMTNTLALLAKANAEARTNQFSGEWLRSSEQARFASTELQRLADTPDRRKAAMELLVRLQELTVLERWLMPKQSQLEVELDNPAFIPLKDLFANTNFISFQLSASSQTPTNLVARIEESGGVRGLRLLGSGLGKGRVSLKMTSLDRSWNSESQLEVNVVPRDWGPSISSLLPDRLEVVAGRLSQEIPFRVVWTNTEPPSKLKVWAESSDETAIPSRDILLRDRQTNWTAQIWPAQAVSNEVPVMFWASGRRASNSIRVLIKVLAEDQDTRLARLDEKLRALKVRAGLLQPAPDLIDPWTGVPAQRQPPGADFSWYTKVEELRKELEKIGGLTAEREADLKKLRQRALLMGD